MAWWQSRSRASKWLVSFVVGVALGVGGLALYAWAQGIAFTPNPISPTQDAAYDMGDAAHRWRNLYLSGTLTMAGSTTVTQIQILGPSLNPTAMAALSPIGTLTSAEQTFTVNGLTTKDQVFVNGPAPTALCPMVGARVSAASTLSLSFTQLTSSVCTPATGTYEVTALRRTS